MDNKRQRAMQLGAEGMPTVHHTKAHYGQYHTLGDDQVNIIFIKKIQVNHNNYISLLPHINPSDIITRITKHLREPNSKQLIKEVFHNLLKSYQKLSVTITPYICFTNDFDPLTKTAINSPTLSTCTYLLIFSGILFHLFTVVEQKHYLADSE